MKRNGMCPICFIKKYLKKPSKVTSIYENEVYNNGAALTPPMGWSSWNTFKNKINEDVIYDTAVAMKEKGLNEAGYQYINIDDCWNSSLRDKNGEQQHDLTTFANGIPALVKKINELGLKVGIYSSNGTLTCEDLPASLGNERRDVLTFARWGCEYFKYDFCHNIPLSSYAPLIFSITLSKKGSKDSITYNCKEAILHGYARLMPNKNIPGKCYVSGLDGNIGAMEFAKVNISEEGDYILTVNVLKKGKYEKFLMVKINEDNYSMSVIPSQKHWNYTARFQLEVKLQKGNNSIRLFNPITSPADSAMLQYINMGRILKEVSAEVAEKNKQPVKPIVFSICEWGKNKPWEWGRFAGNLWRTTPDINPFWPWIVMIYNKNVDLYKYSKKGCWNDPDMLEVGNGKLTYNENISHFSLWCMMCSPLVLGNDLRTMKDDVKEIVTNKNLISINQDVLGKACKRVVKGKTDILAKPLADGITALCFFNKSKNEKKVSFNISELINDDYIRMKDAQNYKIIDQWSNEEIELKDTIESTVPSHSVKVYKIVPIK